MAHRRLHSSSIQSLVTKTIFNFIRVLRENVAKTMNLLRGSGGQFVKYTVVEQDDHFVSEQNASDDDDGFTNDRSSHTALSYVSKFFKVRSLDYLRMCFASYSLICGCV